MGLRPISEAFGGMEDPRDSRNRRYPLTEVIELAVYGTLCGHADFANMAYYLKEREAELTEEFGLAAGVPSHDVFSKVFRALDVQVFLDHLAGWLSAVLSAPAGEHIAIDGKAVRAAARKSVRGKVPYVVSAFACGLGITVGQLEIGDKGNEITDIPKLIEMLDVEGCTVTIDAIGTQKKIMDLITGRGGHFCPRLKRNQRKAYDAVSKLFSERIDLVEDGVSEEDAGVDVHVDEDAGHSHGRDERRTYMTVSLEGDDPAALPKGWDKVRCVGMAVLERDVVGDPSKSSIEVHYHVMDTYRGAVAYARLARGHWGIENSLHHVLDVSFDEDGCTAREGNAISNLTLLRKIVTNIVRQVKGRKSTRAVMTDFILHPDRFVPFLYERIPVGLADGSIRA